MVFLIRFWIFVPATPATYALFVGNLWVWSVSMPALYVYSFLLPGRKLPRGHAGPPHLKDVETTKESTWCWSLLDGRCLATYAVEGSEGAEPLSVANGLVYYVPGAVVWKGRRIASSDFFLSTYGVVASRRLVGDAELNSLCEPEYVLLDKYICNKEVAHIRAR